MTKEIYLKRYTEIPSLLYMLQSKSITMLNPSRWDDKNDARCLESYKKIKGLKTLLSLCFTEAEETYHHWKVYASDGGVGGVCIIFKKEDLINSLKIYDKLRCRKVDYLKVEELEKSILDIEILPFLKRYGYQDEQEFRFVYADKDKTMGSKNLKFSLELIDRICINPWINHDLATSLEKTIQRIDGCEKIKITKSTLVNNLKWAEFADKITNPNILK